MRRRVWHAGVGALAIAVGALAVGDSVAGAGIHRVVLGRSVGGRPIVAFEVGAVNSRRSVLVVGCIHGNETAGVAIARRLERSSPRDVALWIVPVLNPDGLAAGARGNAHGVDLNRNFPWRWRLLGGMFDSGSQPLSEPESRIAYRLIQRLRPRISIWFHQHMNLVDESGANVSIERRFSSLVGLPLVRLPREPGSVVGWENHAFPGTASFVVELPAGTLTSAAVSRYARAVLQIAR